MSAIKALLEQQQVITKGIACAFGKPQFTDEEMEMGRYDHARSDEVDSLEDEQ